MKRWIEHRGSWRRGVCTDRRRVSVRRGVLQVGRRWIRPEKSGNAESVAGFLRWIRGGRYRHAGRRGCGGRSRWTRRGIAIVLVTDLFNVHVDFLLFHVHVHLAVPAIRRRRVWTGRVRWRGTPRCWWTNQSTHSEWQSFWNESIASC